MANTKWKHKRKKIITLDSSLDELRELPELEFRYKRSEKKEIIFTLRLALTDEGLIRYDLCTLRQLREYINREEVPFWDKFKTFPSKEFAENALTYLQQVFSKYGLPEIKLIKEPKKLTDKIGLLEMLYLPEFRTPDKETRWWADHDFLIKLRKTLVSLYVHHGIKTLKQFKKYIKDYGLYYEIKTDSILRGEKYPRFYNLDIKSINYINHVLEKYGVEPVPEVFDESESASFNKRVRRAKKMGFYYP